MKKTLKNTRQIQVFDVQSIYSESNFEYVSKEDEDEVIAELRYFQEKEFYFNHNERE